MIWLVLFLSYASSKELGYDKTMRLFEDNKYEVNIGSLTFISSWILSDLAVDQLCSQATRVFEVSEKLGSPQHFALKDQWIDDDQLAEGYVLEDLHAMIKSKMEKGLFDDLPRNPVDYFLLGTYVWPYGDLVSAGYILLYLAIICRPSFTYTFSTLPISVSPLHRRRIIPRSYLYLFVIFYALLLLSVLSYC